MSLYTFQTQDHLPSISIPTGLHIEECSNADLLAWLGNTHRDEVIRRLANDHLAFVAYIHQQPAAFGWMARGKALIGELAHELVLPIGNRYLWNFRTLEAHRGLGIYPALLQFILQYENTKANRFWVIHAPENNASLRGIKKAGFHYVGKLYTRNGITAIEKTDAAQRHQDLLAEMDIALSEQTSASCWNCSSPYLKKRKPSCCCAAAQQECVDNQLLSLAS